MIIPAWRSLDPGRLWRYLQRLIMVGFGRHKPATNAPTSPAMASSFFSVEADAPTFPAALHQLPRPPRALWCRGRLPAGERLVAVVGARAASLAGRRRAERLAADAVSAG